MPTSTTRTAQLHRPAQPVRWPDRAPRARHEPAVGIGGPDAPLFRWVETPQVFHTNEGHAGLVLGTARVAGEGCGVHSASFAEVHEDLRRYLESDRWFQTRPATSGSLPRRLLLASSGSQRPPAVQRRPRRPRRRPPEGSQRPRRVPLTGIGLFYRQGYFRQELNADGWQQERYQVLDPHAMAVTLVDGVRVSVDLAGDIAARQIWRGRRRPGPAVPARRRRRRERRRGPPRHRPPLRRRPAGTGSARRSCSASAGSALRCGASRRRCSTRTRATPGASARAHPPPDHRRGAHVCGGVEAVDGRPSSPPTRPSPPASIGSSGR